MLIGGNTRQDPFRQFLHSDRSCSVAECLNPRLKGKEMCLKHEREQVIAEETKTFNTTIYFISPIDNLKIVKIGQTNRNAEERLAGLQTAHYQELKLLAWILLPQGYEKMLHLAFADHRIRGEWFHRTEEIDVLIEQANTKNPELFILLYNRVMGARFDSFGRPL